MQRPPPPTPYWLRAASGRSLLGHSGLPCVLAKHAPSGRENPPGACQSCNSKLLASMGRVLRRSDGGSDSLCNALLQDLQDWVRWLSSVIPSTNTHLRPCAHHLMLKGSFTYSTRRKSGFAKEVALVNKNRCDCCPWGGKSE